MVAQYFILRFMITSIRGEQLLKTDIVCMNIQIVSNQLIEFSLDCSSPDNAQKSSFPVNPCIPYPLNFDFLYFTPVASAYMKIIQIHYEQCHPDP